MLLCKILCIRIVPIHLRREDPRIQKADDGSKQTDTDCWGVDWLTFREARQKMEFTIDLFASDKNNKCDRFFSNFFCSNTLGIDAFCHSWEGEVAWVCPPINLVMQTIKKIRNTTMAGALYVPEWKTADYWTEIFDKEGNLRPPFKAAEINCPFIIQENFYKNSPFRGRA